MLEPAAEIAPKMLHPVIGWPIERLLLHLQLASDALALVSPSEPLRGQLAALLVERRGARLIDSPEFDNGRPSLAAAVDNLADGFGEFARRRAACERSSELPYAAAAFPKLSVLLDADVAHRGADKLQWSTLVRQPGRGPTLRLQTTDPQEIEAEATGGGGCRVGLI